MSAYDVILGAKIDNVAMEIHKLTEAITKAMEPMVTETMEISMDAQAAVATLKEICKDAEECGRGCCPIFDWCQEHLPDTRAALPPKYWAVPE